VTKESSGSSSVINRVEEITAYSSNITTIILTVDKLNAFEGTRFRNQNAIINQLNIDGTSVLLGDDDDLDGLSNDAENQIYFTDPNNPDSDGDGYGDGEEISFGGNPLNSTIVPGDEQNPTNTISGIITSSTYRLNIPIQFYAQDNRGMKSVIIKINSTLIFQQDVVSTQYWLNGKINGTYTLDTRVYSDGNYVITIEATDIHDRITLLTYNVIFDNTPVTVQLVGPNGITNNSRIPSGIALLLQFSETPATVTYQWDNAAGQSSLPLVPAGDGQHQLYITTSDAVGNSLSTTFTFTVDDSVVLIYLNSPSNNSYVHSGTTVQINFSSTPTQVYYSWDGQTNQTTLSAIPTAQGPHNLEIWTFNDIGNMYYVQYTFTIDDYAPYIILVSPENGVTTTSGTLIDIIFNEPIESVVYSWDGKANFTGTPVLPAGDYQHYLDVYVVDFAMNANYTRFYFTTDDPLFIQLNSPQNNSQIISGMPINLTITGSNGFYQYRWNSDPYQNVSLSVFPISPITDGKHTLVVFAEDTNGILLKSYVFTIQNPLINITLISPVNNTVLKVETTINLEFDKTPVLVYYQWNNGANETTLKVIPAIEGQYDLRVYALNEHGSWAMKYFHWTVDINDVPTVQLLYPLGGETLTGVMTISWTGSDLDHDPLVYAIYIRLDSDNTWILIAEGISQTIYHFDTTLVDSGEYWLKIIVSDGFATNESIVANKIIIWNPDNADPNPFTNPFENLDGETVTWIAGGGVTATVGGVAYGLYHSKKGVPKPKKEPKPKKGSDSFEPTMDSDFEFTL
jgi:hypothetical protein